MRHCLAAMSFVFLTACDLKVDVEEVDVDEDELVSSIFERCVNEPDSPMCQNLMGDTRNNEQPAQNNEAIEVTPTHTEDSTLLLVGEWDSVPERPDRERYEYEFEEPRHNVTCEVETDSKGQEHLTVNGHFSAIRRHAGLHLWYPDTLRAGRFTELISSYQPEVDTQEEGDALGIMHAGGFIIDGVRKLKAVRPVYDARVVEIYELTDTGAAGVFYFRDMCDDSDDTTEPSCNGMVFAYFRCGEIRYR